MISFGSIPLYILPVLKLWNYLKLGENGKISP
jgi:hypothetical protein